MSDTITIKLRNKKARKIIEGLQAIDAIEIIEDKIPSHWSSKKKQQARELLEAFNEAKLAEQGKIKLQSAQSLLDEL